MLFFTGAQLVVFGQVIKTLESGHAVLMRRAFDGIPDVLSPEIDPELVILGNRRADIPALRDDGTISLIGLALALWIAQTAPKYGHGMCQFWNHPTRNLWQVQQALYERLLAACVEPDANQAALKLGAALHTLQDTYTEGHTQRTDHSNEFSPMVRLHFSPSRQHPFISPRDTVWADEANGQLTTPAQTAIRATVAALALFSQYWRDDLPTTRQAICDFVNRYTPIENQIFTPE